MGNEESIKREAILTAMELELERRNHTYGVRLLQLLGLEVRT